MNQDDVIEMAKLAGMTSVQLFGATKFIEVWTPDLMDFANLVAAKERENNVKLLMRLADVYEHADKQGSADDIYKIVDHIKKRV